MNVAIYLSFFFKQAWWFIVDRCGYCGGEIEVFSWKKAYCKSCNKLN